MACAAKCTPRCCTTAIGVSPAWCSTRCGASRSLIIADNEPYFVSDETDYTIPRHGEARGLPHVEIEIRQDLVSDAAGQTEWASRITAALQAAEQALLGESK